MMNLFWLRMQLPYNTGLPDWREIPLSLLGSLLLAQGRIHPGLRWQCQPKTGPRRHHLWLPLAESKRHKSVQCIKKINPKNSSILCGPFEYMINTPCHPRWFFDNTLTWSLSGENTWSASCLLQVDKQGSCPRLGEGQGGCSSPLTCGLSEKHLFNYDKTMRV